MAPETDPIQFPRQIWQTVSDLARSCLVEHSFCPDQSRIENLRCVHFENERDTKFGEQAWYFEAIGVDQASHRHMLYGALRFSVQYGLLEPEQAKVFEEANERLAFLNSDSETQSEMSVWNQASTRFWVRTACLGIIVSALVWCALTVSLLNDNTKHGSGVSSSVTLEYQD
jgi:hypothetical protein